MTPINPNHTHTQNSTIEALKHELAKVVVGQEEMIEGLIIGLLSEGHVLIEGMPGLAKTTTINAMANAMGLETKRLQFTPDLLPSDIIGVQIYNPSDHTFSIKRGPLFTNLLLADEINRAPAKVQSALLEAMQESQVTIADESFKLPQPFMVMATQNPIEQAGVYPLPEAQLDRFMLKIVVDYNSEEEELHIIRKSAMKQKASIEPTVTLEMLHTLKDTLYQVHIDDALERYIVQLIASTRDPKKYALAHLENTIAFGASPRATIDLLKAAKAHAFLEGKTFVSPSNIGKMFYTVLRHRVILSYEAKANGVTVESVLSEILEQLPIP
jgi:MoxR-like ATPase